MNRYNSRNNIDIVKKTSHANFYSDSDEDEGSNYEESNLQNNMGSTNNAIRSRQVSQNIQNALEAAAAVSTTSNGRRRSQYIELMAGEEDPLAKITQLSNQDMFNPSNFQFIIANPIQMPINNGEKKKGQKRASAFVNPTDLKTLTSTQNQLKRYMTIGGNNNNSTNISNTSTNNSINNHSNVQQQQSPQQPQAHGKNQNKNMQFEMNVSQSSVNRKGLKISDFEEVLPHPVGGPIMNVSKREVRRQSVKQGNNPSSNNESVAPTLNKLNRSQSKKFKENNGQRSSIYDKAENHIQFQDDESQNYRFCLFDIEEKFDLLKEYIRYFPSNNMSAVLKSFFLNQIHSKCRGRKNKKKKFQKEQIVRRKNTLRQSTKLIGSSKKIK